jgi:hypothetical protein
MMDGQRTLHFLMLMTSLNVVLRRGGVGPVVTTVPRSLRTEDPSTGEISRGEEKRFERRLTK